MSMQIPIRPLPEDSQLDHDTDFISAPVLDIDRTPLYVVEFPGHIRKPKSPRSMLKVKELLGGEQRLLKNFLTGRLQPELSYRRRDPFSTPIQGELVPTQNIVIKVTKRYKVPKKPDSTAKLTAKDIPEDAIPDECSYQLIGVAKKTIRFVSLADYQYQIDTDNEIYKIKKDMIDLKFEKLQNFKIDKLPEEEYANLQVVPPLITSHYPFPVKYRYQEPGAFGPESDNEGKKK
ncbi:General transcription factor 3C polypeptide 5 [Actinomortierella ambigua]|nr:General transcription factor 3C polypeptide 5 [Actinomortierella ambigua]